MQNTTHSTPKATVMTVQQASEYLGLAVSTLNKWRCHGGGPVFIKMGRAVRYRIEDLEIYLQESSAASTSNY
jgi:excisionase family DNA binding protein